MEYILGFVLDVVKHKFFFCTTELEEVQNATVNENSQEIERSWVILGCAIS